MTTKAMRSTGSAAFALTMTAGIVALLAAHPVSARPLPDGAFAHHDLATETVSTAGLNLASEAGRARLDTRIRSASRRVCDTQAMGVARSKEQICRAAAFDGTRAQVAALIEQARGLAAAGGPVGISTVLTVVAPESK